MDSMKELEKQADRLLAELVDVRRKNRLLTGRVNRLEKAARARDESGAPLPEKAEVVRRLRRLVERLERLDSR